MMMNAASMGRTASRVGRVVAGKSEPSLQRGLSARAGSRNGLLSTRSALGGVSQIATRFAVTKPLRQLPTGQVCTAVIG